jgi:hypothetical protein
MNANPSVSVGSCQSRNNLRRYLYEQKRLQEDAKIAEWCGYPLHIVTGLRSRQPHAYNRLRDDHARSIAEEAAVILRLAQTRRARKVSERRTRDPGERLFRLVTRALLGLLAALTAAGALVALTHSYGRY